MFLSVFFVGNVVGWECDCVCVRTVVVFSRMAALQSLNERERKSVCVGEVASKRNNTFDSTDFFFFWLPVRPPEGLQAFFLAFFL